MTAEPISEEEWQQHRDEARQTLPKQLAEAASLPDVLLRYQALLLQTTALSQFVVCEKSRRIGMTWAVAADAVLTSGSKRSAGGMDALYIGYNMEMAREFIDTCAMWARAFLPAASDVEEFLFKEKDEAGAEKDIGAFRIRFASGFEIVALSSKPRSLRGRQGYVIFDEAAFHESLDELLKAAMALLMWGGKVLVISTHDGVDNPFNELINDIRTGKQKGQVIKVTFDEAVEQGLYDRIALVGNKPQTPEARLKWIEGIRGFYGTHAGEELDCIPRSGSGVYITGASVDACMTEEHVVVRFEAPDRFELRPKAARKLHMDSFLEDLVRPHLSRYDDQLMKALGEDFGRTIDLTVLALGQELKDMTLDIPLILELKNTPIEQQKQAARFLIEGVTRFVGGKFDATGNGLALAEWAQEEFGFDRIEAVKLSQTWYLENMPGLRQRYEDQTIRHAKDSFIKSDVRTIRLVNGIPSIPSTKLEGRHGDAAVALCMLEAAMKSDYQPFDYRRVDPTKIRDGARPINLTSGIRAHKGVW